MHNCPTKIDLKYKNCIHTRIYFFGKIMQTLIFASLTLYVSTYCKLYSPPPIPSRQCNPIKLVYTFPSEGKIVDSNDNSTTNDDNTSTISTNAKKLTSKWFRVTSDNSKLISHTGISCESFSRTLKSIKSVIL